MKFFDQFFQSQSDSESPSLIKRLGVKKLAIICGIAVAVLALVIGLAIGLSGGDEPEQQLPSDQTSQDTPPDSTVPDQGNQDDEPKQDTPEIQPTAFNTLVGTFTNREIKDEASAILAVQDVAKDLGYTNATDELTTVSVNTVDNLTYYRLQQNYQGIPVYGSTFVVIADENGVAQGLTGNAADANENISLIPTVDRKTIQQKMADHFGAGAICSELTEDSLTIYHDKNTGKQMLAYALTALINGETYSVVVDAATGEVLQGYTLVYTDDVPTVKEMLRDRVDVYNANGMRLCYRMVDIGGVEHLFSRDKDGIVYVYDWRGSLKHQIGGGKTADISTWSFW
jgi:Zn-dependent metalloprotease